MKMMKLSVVPHVVRFMVAITLAASVCLARPVGERFTGGMENTQWFRKWYNLWLVNKFSAAGWAKLDGELVTQHAGFQWVAMPVGQWATPHQGLSAYNSWWENGTKTVRVFVLYTVDGHIYSSGDTSSHTF